MQSNSSDLWMALVDLVVCDAVMLMVVMLSLAWHPHLGFHVLQQILGRVLQVAVAAVNGTLTHCSCHLHKACTHMSNVRSLYCKPQVAVAAVNGTFADCSCHLHNACIQMSTVLILSAVNFNLLLPLSGAHASTAAATSHQVHTQAIMLILSVMASFAEHIDVKGTVILCGALEDAVATVTGTFVNCNCHLIDAQHEQTTPLLDQSPTLCWVLIVT